MSNILTFEPRKPAPRNPSFEPPTNPLDLVDDAREIYPTGRQLASRKRNPLRHPCHRVSLAVTIIGKVRRKEALPDCLDDLEIIREGAIAARHLADELDRILEVERSRQ